MVYVRLCEVSPHILVGQARKQASNRSTPPFEYDKLFIKEAWMTLNKRSQTHVSANSIGIGCQNITHNSIIEHTYEVMWAWEFVHVCSRIMFN